MENTSLHGTENYSDLLRASCRWDHAYGFAVRVANFYQRHVSKLKRCVFPKESRDSSLLKSSATRTILYYKNCLCSLGKEPFYSQKKCQSPWGVWLFLHPSLFSCFEHMGTRWNNNEQYHQYRAHNCHIWRAGARFRFCTTGIILYNPRAVVVQLACSPRRAFRQATGLSRKVTRSQQYCG